MTPRFRLSARERVQLARIQADEDEREARRERAARRGAASDEGRLVRIAYFIAERVCRRWTAAGYTTVRLEDGLPRPERPHPADWQHGGSYPTCGACGRAQLKTPMPATCPGPSAFDLVYQAILDGVPFGLVDGLPMAGARPEPGDVAAKLARATCQPLVRREERQAA